MLKRLAKSPFVQRLIVALVFAYIRFVYLTSRVERDWHPEAAALLASGRPFIAAFWHGRILMMPYHLPQSGASVHVLISKHRDGAMIARAVRPFGVEVIAGSSRRGGREALHEMVRLLAAGKIVAITPDGPTGPRQRAKFGIAYTAITAGVPVVPVTYAARRRRLIGSWDRFLLALPFNRLLLRAGAPITVNGLGIEAAREQIEAAMIAQLDTADARFGFPPIPPGPPLTVEPQSEAAGG